MRSPIYSLNEQHFEKILSKKAVFIGNMILIVQMVLLFGVLGGAVLIIPDDESAPWTPFQKGYMVFTGIVFVYMCYSILCHVGRAGNKYLERRARDVISRRPDRILDPRAQDLFFVEIVPRQNFGKPMLEDAADVGLLHVDTVSRRVLYEGGIERWSIEPADIISCHWDFFASDSHAGTSVSIKRFRVILRIDAGEYGQYERCIAPRYSSGVFGNKKRRQRVEKIAADIESIRASSQGRTTKASW